MILVIYFSEKVFSLVLYYWFNDIFISTANNSFCSLTLVNILHRTKKQKKAIFQMAD